MTTQTTSLAGFTQADFDVFGIEGLEDRMAHSKSNSTQVSRNRRTA
jgi:uncharacterized protein YktB (UPF0637 family)